MVGVQLNARFPAYPSGKKQSSCRSKNLSCVACDFVAKAPVTKSVLTFVRNSSVSLIATEIVYHTFVCNLPNKFVRPAKGKRQSLPQVFEFPLTTHSYLKWRAINQSRYSTFPEVFASQFGSDSFRRGFAMSRVTEETRIRPTVWKTLPNSTHYVGGFSGCQAVSTVIRGFSVGGGLLACVCTCRPTAQFSGPVPDLACFRLAQLAAMANLATNR